MIRTRSAVAGSPLLASPCTRPRAGAPDVAGREALLRYVLRPSIAQERLQARQGGLVRSRSGADDLAIRACFAYAPPVRRGARLIEG